VKFFFPDSQDQVDPNFDFEREASPEFRVRQRDDRYAHEVLQAPPYDGVLVSKSIIDGVADASGKYTAAQRNRLYRLGVRKFYRLDQRGFFFETMGDCGSFSYVREDDPPYSIEDLLDFYEGCGFDYGISLDHVVLGYDPTDSSPALEEWRRRQSLTLELAAQFLRDSERFACTFRPIGAAQGWSPRSYALAVGKLQEAGYRHIALGGMVPLKTDQIAACLRAISTVRLPDVQLHLLGVTRVEHMTDWSALGVTSFDSTSPFRQAFKDDKDNYYTLDRNFLAIRVPQVEGNAKLGGRIRAGQVSQARARELEQRCLKRLVDYDQGETTLPSVMEALMEYGALLDPNKDQTTQYRALLELKPWKSCACGVCEQVGIQVVIFRGTERNKRRGFHNLSVFCHRLQQRLHTPRTAIAIA
jgi:hypothetical protein